MSMHSLGGLRVLNTRPNGQNTVLSEAILHAGGVALELPAIAIEPTPIKWMNVFPDLSTIDQAIFISTNAVMYFFNGLATAEILWPSHIVVSAIGKSTAASLAARGVPFVNTPSIADSEHLLQLPMLLKIQKQKIILVKGEDGRTEIAETLIKRGAHFIPISVYRRSLPLISPAFIASLWQEDKVDIILFTSQQAIHNLFNIFGENAHTWLCSKPCLVISKRLADTASNFGIHTIIISSYERLIEALYDFKKGITHDNKH